MLGDDLIMELSPGGEQGPGRETQVQPPLGAWAYYFNLDWEDDCVLKLHDQQNGGAPEDRPVVRHALVRTLEMNGAPTLRPAIVRFHRVGPDEYQYWFFDSSTAEYAHLLWILENFRNPHQRKGRRWFII